MHSPSSSRMLLVNFLAALDTQPVALPQTDVAEVSTIIKIIIIL